MGCLMEYEEEISVSEYEEMLAKLSAEISMMEKSEGEYEEMLVKLFMVKV
jgi:hypothetical protein